MNMKTIKVAEATNTQLDWLVAKCEGAKDIRFRGEYWIVTDTDGGWEYLANLPYSTDPSLMWPIIEREGIDVFTSYEGSRIEGSFAEKTGWAARRHTHGGPLNPKRFLGPTSLIAAARCYVASKLGENVEVPEELT